MSTTHHSAGQESAPKSLVATALREQATAVASEPWDPAAVATWQGRRKRLQQRRIASLTALPVLILLALVPLSVDEANKPTVEIAAPVLLSLPSFDPQPNLARLPVIRSLHEEQLRTKQSLEQAPAFLLRCLPTLPGLPVSEGDTVPQ